MLSIDLLLKHTLYTYLFVDHYNISTRKSLLESKRGGGTIHVLNEKKNNLFFKLEELRELLR